MALYFLVAFAAVFAIARGQRVTDVYSPGGVRYQAESGDCLSGQVIELCQTCQTSQSCASRCDGTPNCVGFSFNAQQNNLCITRGNCNANYQPNGLNYYYSKQAAGGVCQPNPCRNGGQCQPFGSNFQCVCTPDFYGQYCETPVTPTPCSPNPCRNNGQCYPSGSEYFCQCTGGYTGQQCQIPPATNPCQPNPCLNNGQCRDIGAGKFICICDVSRFTGDRCQTPLSTRDPCTPNPCLNAGFCTRDTATTYQCRCASGYTGTNCEIPPGGGSLCLPNPCQNNGQCSLNSFGQVTCTCLPQYAGNRCETPIGPISWPEFNGFTRFSGSCRSQYYKECSNSNECRTTETCKSLCDKDSTGCQGFTFNKVSFTCRLYAKQCDRIVLEEQSAPRRSIIVSNKKAMKIDPDESYYQRQGICSYESPDSKYSARWKYDSTRDTVTFTVTGDPNPNGGRNWVGVGVSDKDSLDFIDFFVGFNGTNGKPYFVDSYTGGDRTWSANSVTKTLTNAGIRRDNDMLTVTFTRARRATKPHLEMYVSPVRDPGFYLVFAHQGGEWLPLGADDYYIKKHAKDTVVRGPFWLDPCKAPSAVGSECTQNPCRNNGNCIQEVDKYSCDCSEGFTGAACAQARQGPPFSL